jgi:hypothetical protein
MRTSWSPPNSSLSLPTQRDILRRSRELQAYRANPAETESQSAENDLLEDQAPGIEYETDTDIDSRMQTPDEPPADPPSSTSALLPEEALYSLSGRIVRALAPHTESDPAAILLQFLAALGNILGRAPHCRVGPTRHGLNLFVVLVGESSKARKGTSWRQIASLFANVDPDWHARRILSARPTAFNILDTLSSPAESDRRLFVLAEEFVSVLHMLTRENSHLSPLLRCAWDGADLATHNGHRGLHVAGAHLSLVGHITQGELAPLLGRAESHNGFANRCLWASVQRSQLLPEGGDLPAETHLAISQDLRNILDWVNSLNNPLFTRTDAARDLWREAYPQLAEGRPDAYGAATSRAEAQVLRLSALYAATDRTTRIDTAHLQAALALWDYCRNSARLLFDTTPIDPIARRINQALDLAPDGLSRRAINDLFHGHVSKERIEQALQQLSTLGLSSQDLPSGRGRRGKMWAKPGAPHPGTQT